MVLLAIIILPNLHKTKRKKKESKQFATDGNSITWPFGLLSMSS